MAWQHKPGLCGLNFCLKDLRALFEMRPSTKTGFRWGAVGIPSMSLGCDCGSLESLAVIPVVQVDEEYLLKDVIFLGSYANPMARMMWVA